MARQKTKERTKDTNVIEESTSPKRDPEIEELLDSVDLLLEDLDEILAEQDARAYRDHIRAWAARQGNHHRRRYNHKEYDFYDCSGAYAGSADRYELALMSPCGDCV